MSFKCSSHLLQQHQQLIAKSILSTAAASATPATINTSAVAAYNKTIKNTVSHLDHNHSSAKISNELNISSLFNTKPNISHLALQSLIQSHKMDSKYLSNITNYKPHYYNNSPITIWHRLPVFRRSSVLILMFLGKSGELRVILTRRSRKLSSFSGHACLPGGRADTGLESEWMTARRETEEEIGISQSDLVLKEKFGCSIEQIGFLPSYLSRTFLAVRPCIGFLKWSPSKLTNFDEQHLSSIVLNPGESASIYSVPLRDFLQPFPRNEKPQECLKLTYKKTKWGGLPWNLRSFLFPVVNPNEVRWLEDIADLSSEEDDGEGTKIRDVWGLTLNILHDLAQITYNGPHNAEIGEEELIYSLMNEGEQFSTKVRSDFELSMMKNNPNSSFADKLSKKTFRELKKLYTNTL